VPTYEYICENCRYEFERFESIKAQPLKKCPQCGKAALKRLIGHGSGIIFKGSGFYQTDYRSESYKKAENKEKDQSRSGTKEQKAKPKADKNSADQNPAAPKN